MGMEGPRGQGSHAYLYNRVVQVLLNWAGTVALQPKEKRRMKWQVRMTHEGTGGPWGLPRKKPPQGPPCLWSGEPAPPPQMARVHQAVALTGVLAGTLRAPRLLWLPHPHPSDQQSASQGPLRPLPSQLVHCV